MRGRLAQVVSRGNDRSLVFPAWEYPTADDRTVVYQKGALVLHQLRERVGEDDFWKAIRVYTRRYFGQSVTTDALRLAFEEVSGTDLREFFARVVRAENR